MQNYTIPILKDCFQTMDPFCKLALSLTCTDYNQSFIVHIREIIIFVKSNKMISHSYIKWIYDIFGLPNNTIRNIIDLKFTELVKIHFARIVMYDPRRIENVILCSHVNQESYDDYITKCQNMKESDVKFAYALLARFNVEIGLYKCWVDDRVVRLMKSIVYERYVTK